MQNHLQVPLRPKLNTVLQKVPQNLPWQRWLYPALVGLIYLVWLTYMTYSNSWALFQELWPVSVAMTLGSFIAGATPQGGATVAFPVFTKVLQIPASEARTFGLMIQAVGMSMVSILIIKPPD